MLHVKCRNQDKLHVIYGEDGQVGTNAWHDKLFILRKDQLIGVHSLDENTSAVGIGTIIGIAHYITKDCPIFWYVIDELS